MGGLSLGSELYVRSVVETKESCVLLVRVLRSHEIGRVSVDVGIRTVYRHLGGDM